MLRASQYKRKKKCGKQEDLHSLPRALNLLEQVRPKCVKRKEKKKAQIAYDKFYFIAYFYRQGFAWAENKT